MPRNKNFGRGRGRGGRQGRGRGGGGGRSGGGGQNFQDDRKPFELANKHNEKFEKFYDMLGVVPAGEEREAFWAAMRRELPNSFRFTGSKGHALSVRDNLVTRFFPLISKITHEEKPVELPTEIPWYPEGLAYSMTTPKNVVRKYEPFKEFQRFLVSETGVGNISRQEHVSMIPPLLMDIQPHHTVLDLCAAPGSKSAQLVEAIHAGEEVRTTAAIKATKGIEGNGTSQSTEEGGRATGLLIANDVNYQRAQMLVHQVKRLNSPNLIVTNHDATQFPSIELPSPPPAPGQQKRGKYLKFDRILADVPCSGDGTARKNPSVWKDWSPQNGLGLYITQVRILTRSLQMLKVGGRVVYSTCSMNPMENEAVVSSAIERCGGVGKVRLLDCSQELPELIRSNGLTDWSVMSRNGQMYESFAEAVQYEDKDGKIVPGMFAPEEAEQIPLQHCMRVYPHQQDTGGFFIAVLEKLSEIKAKPEAESKSMKKDWEFSSTQPSKQTLNEPVVAPPPSGHMVTFQELLDEVYHPQAPIETAGDTSSSAARQNEDVPEVETSPGIKRKADDREDETGAKRAKVVEESNGADHGLTSSRPLPPSVAMAVEASNGFSEHTNKQNGDYVTDQDTTATSTAAATPNASNPDVQPPLQRRRRNDTDVPNEEAFKYLSPHHPELETIFSFYNLHGSFPRDRFLVRNHAGDPVKGIYYSSQLVKDILTTNEGRGMKFVHAGVKMFMKQDSQGQDICRWHIQTEGLPIIEGWVGDSRTIRLWKKATLRKLLIEMFPKIGPLESRPDEGWRALGEIGEQVLHIPMGCCVLRVEATDAEDGFREPLVLPLWRSLHSLNLMLPKEDRRAMLLRLFNEDVELINHSHGGQREPRPGGSNGKGSSSATADAREVERRMERVADHEDDAATPADEVPVAAVVESDINENGVDLAAEAREQDLMDSENRVQVELLEEREDDDVKLAAAMPERVGEVDEANSTV